MIVLDFILLFVWQELALSVSRNLENALMKEMKSDSYTTRIIAA